MRTPSGDVQRHAACQAVLVLNESVRELIVPHEIHKMAQPTDDGPVNIPWMSAMRHTALMSIVIGLWRLHEARAQFLVPWLFSDEELNDLGVPSLDMFFGGTLKSFETVRHQYVGHVTAKEAKSGKPGEIIRPDVLGRALRDTGLSDSTALLKRVEQELVPNLERLVRTLVARFPESEEYFRESYPIALEQAMRAPRGTSTLGPNTK
jgi:hypothetical protein